MIYLDASALVTIVVQRQHAVQLREYLEQHADARATSTIGLIETVRTCDLIGNFPHLLRRLLADHTEVPLNAAIRDEAARLPGSLRSLDAIHVATAQRLGTDLTALVTYDQRMADAAKNAGLPVAMPGMDR